MFYHQPDLFKPAECVQIKAIFKRFYLMTLPAVWPGFFQKTYEQNSLYFVLCWVVLGLGYVNPPGAFRGVPV